MATFNINRNKNNLSQTKRISVIGAGLAGSECALQLAAMGFEVDLYEMRKVKNTPAHKTTDFAELVCSNSFGSMSEVSAPGELKWEAEKLGSFVLAAAKQNAVPAGQALGIDRERFASLVTKIISENPKITVHHKTIESIDDVPRLTVVATGPLTDEPLAESIKKHFSPIMGDDFLYFFDAIAPIIDADTINTEIAWKADRYNKGTADYYNCPMNKDQYLAFIQAIKEARKIEPKNFETTEFFEGCMPIEAMIDRGDQTLRFGPMKPVGLDNPKTGRWAYAVVQLRQDNKEATAYNIVGFQTRMAYGEQTRIFRMIPGLENAEFLKLGSIHRNMYLNTPKLLNRDLSSKLDPELFFAGQITGVEGYFESTCIGLLVAHFIWQRTQNEALNAPPRDSAMGSLLEAITDPFRADHFQPTNINFALLPPLPEKIRDKKLKKEIQITKARTALLDWIGVIPTTEHELPKSVAPTPV